MTRPTEAEANTTFWKHAAEVAAADNRPDPYEAFHQRHRKMSVQRAMANCEPCGIAKIRWMLGQPKGSHQHNHGVRLARTYGITTKEEENNGD